MAQDDLMAEVDERANLAFTNKMEMLTFYLSDSQQYGINVFKIIEVIETPKTITQLPHANESINGAINFRGKMVTVIDISHGLGMERVNHREEISYIIVCEYSNTTQGFLVNRPNKLLNVSWGDVKKPEGSVFNSGYLTGLTYDDNAEAIQILDVEKILGEIIGIDDEVDEKLIAEGNDVDMSNLQVMILDDSKAAHTLLNNALNKLGVPHVMFEEGERAFKALEDSLNDGARKFCLIISDIEMPGMDGFTFTRQVKAHPKLSGIHLVLHSSMSNKANRTKAKSVGADGFIAKFQPDEIARLVLDRLKLAKNRPECQQQAA